MTDVEYDRYIKAAIEGTISDEDNPAFIFSETPTDLLRQIVEDKIDVAEIARRELRCRRPC